jgi:hypothetical protein
MSKTMKERFPLGLIVATPGALRAILDAGQEPGFFLAKHAAGDWGLCDREDSRANDYDLEHGGRLLSVYKTLLGARIWIITEWDRSATTVLLPEEY